MFPLRPSDDCRRLTCVGGGGGSVLVGCGEFATKTGVRAPSHHLHHHYRRPRTGACRPPVLPVERGNSRLHVVLHPADRATTDATFSPLRCIFKIRAMSSFHLLNGSELKFGRRLIFFFAWLCWRRRPPRPAAPCGSPRPVNRPRRRRRPVRESASGKPATTAAAHRAE